MSVRFLLRLAIAVSIHLPACSQSKSNEFQIQGVKIRQLYPIIDNDGKVSKYDTEETEIYYSGDLVLYKLSYGFDSVNIGTNETVLSERRHHYFIVAADSMYGYDYDEHKSQFKQRVLADSLLKWQWASKVNVYPMVTENIPRLISSFQNTDSGTVHELYSYTHDDTSAHGTLFFGYSKKLNGLKYSLSKEMDSIKKMKLYKVLQIQDPRYMKAYGITIDKIKSAYEIEDITMIRPEIIRYFEDYQRTNNSGINRNAAQQ